LHPVALIVGARGVSGVRAVRGSVSDGVVHYSPVPLLVVPPANAEELRQTTQDGPVLVACDGSSGANTALVVARSLWPLRRYVVASVDCRAADDVASEEMGSVAMATLHHGHRPVLAVPPADRLAEPPAQAASVGASSS